MTNPNTQTVTTGEWINTLVAEAFQITTIALVGFVSILAVAATI
jgi:hypothetical protein